MADTYNEKVLDTFKHPKHMGEISSPDGVGKVGNPKCGDLMEVSIKISKNDSGKEIIKDVKVKTFGCVAAIATSSTMAELVKGKTLEFAEKLNNKDVAKKLGGLPAVKLHCSNLAADALHKAIDDYKKSRIQNSIEIILKWQQLRILKS